MTNADEPTDLVDEFYRPYVRALGNLVILFAQSEAELLSLVAELCGSELEAVRLLKDADKAKDRIIEMIRGLSLSDFDREELIGGIGGFWSDKEIRNRLIHDDWFPSLEEDGTGKVGTRGLMRKKVPAQVFGSPRVEEVWALARRFQEFSYLFSHRAWVLSRERRGDDQQNE
jgi:hypothetical protein